MNREIYNWTCLSIFFPFSSIINNKNVSKEQVFTLDSLIKSNEQIVYLREKTLTIKKDERDKNNNIVSDIRETKCRERNNNYSTSFIDYIINIFCRRACCSLKYTKNII